MCNTSPGATFKEDLAMHSPRGEFCQWQPREPVLELCLTCVCASVMNGVEVLSQGTERSWETKSAAGRKPGVCMVWGFFYCCC